MFISLRKKQSPGLHDPIPDTMDLNHKATKIHRVNRMPSVINHYRYLTYNLFLNNKILSLIKMWTQFPHSLMSACRSERTNSNDTPMQDPHKNTGVGNDSAGVDNDTPKIPQQPEHPPQSPGTESSKTFAII